VFTNISDEFQCSDCWVIMYSRMQPAGTCDLYTGTGCRSTTVSVAFAVSIFRDVTRPGRSECRQQVPPVTVVPAVIALKILIFTTTAVTSRNLALFKVVFVHASRMRIASPGLRTSP
jgi:hypothetical protein